MIMNVDLKSTQLMNLPSFAIIKLNSFRIGENNEKMETVGYF